MLPSSILGTVEKEEDFALKTVRTRAQGGVYYMSTVAPSPSELAKPAPRISAAPMQTKAGSQPSVHTGRAGTANAAHTRLTVSTSPQCKGPLQASGLFQASEMETRKSTDVSNCAWRELLDGVMLSWPNLPSSSP